MNDRVKGTVIAAVGVLCVTPDAVLVRWATHLGAPRLQLLFWRLVSNTVFGSLMIAALNADRGLKEVARSAARGPGPLVLATLFQATTSLLLPAAFLLTFAANVMLCLSMSPLFAALIGVFVLKDSLPTRTAWAIVAAVVSMVVMFLPGALRGENNADESTDGDHDRGGTVGAGAGTVGDVFALLAAVTTALYITTSRATALSSRPDVPVEIATAAGAAVAAAGCAAAILSNGESLLDGTSPLFFLAMTFNGFGLAAIYFSFAVAPRYISGAQVALISLLETLLAPLYVFIIYDEVPPASVLCGGGLLLGAVATHEILALREDQRQHAAIKTTTTTAMAAVPPHPKYDALGLPPSLP
mmetsp:Transcript_22824/g.73390  ORF Transcript_22824/g.73390 Transcript_22824/m.73390 type:complete len:357 (+) Transcript_22824:30-1100(+)